MRLFWILLLLFSLLSSLLDAKGSFGGGRGSSGARSSSSFSSGSRSSSSSSSSSFGSYGSSSRSYTPSSSSYRAGNSQYNSNFRQNVFHTSTTTTTFMYSPMTHSHVIISPITPIYFGSYHYYWGGHYVADTQRPQQCEYEITDKDEELRNVTFSNGTSPKTLTFGCRGGEQCCGLECCGGSSTLVWIIAIIVIIVILVLCCSYCSKNGRCNWQDDVISAPAVISTTTTTHSYTVPSAPPPPPGFQPQFVPPGQPIYSSTPQYHAYEHQGSPYEMRPVTAVSAIPQFKC